MIKLKELDFSKIEPEHYYQWWPTQTKIGTRERVEVYAIRWARGDEIYHPHDLRELDWHDRNAPYRPGIREVKRPS